MTLHDGVDREITGLVLSLRALANYRHDDHKLGNDAADMLEQLWGHMKLRHADKQSEWRDGEPANLEAAAADALLWLRWLDRARIVGPGNAPALSDCIAALAGFLGDA